MVYITLQMQQQCRHWSGSHTSFFLALQQLRQHPQVATFLHLEISCTLSERLQCHGVTYTPHLLSLGVVFASHPVQAGLLGVKVTGLGVVVVGAQVNMVGLQASMAATVVVVAEV
jgi:hypothetical protein